MITVIHCHSGPTKEHTVGALTQVFSMRRPYGYILNIESSLPPPSTDPHTCPAVLLLTLRATFSFVDSSVPVSLDKEIIIVTDVTSQLS